MRSRAVFLLATVLLFGRGTFGATQLITNGGFEFVSSAPWQLAGTFPAGTGVVPSPGQAHSGNNLLILGKIPGADVQNAFQTISIPSNALAASLSYFWNVSSGDPAGSVGLVSLISTTNANPTVLKGVDTN